MSPPEVECRRTLESTTSAWVEDETSDVVWAGDYEGRWGIRMAQQTRDFTTVWFDTGDLTLGYEAYLLPAPPKNREEVYRQCLARNWRSFRAHIAIDRRGDLYVVGRMPVTEVTPETLDEAVGAVYALVDLSFRPLIRAGFA